MSWKRFVGWVKTDDPFDPIDPGYGQSDGIWDGPVDPGYGRPGYGGRPDNSLPGGGGHPWLPGYGRPERPDNSLPGGGYPSTGPIKPPGRPIVPSHPGQRPPMGGAPPHPWIPGHWEPIDPGWGKPPLWGFLPVDPGWGVDEGGAPAKPDQSLPTPPPPAQTKPPVGTWPPSGGGGGNWVPVDPDYGLPTRPCPGGRPHPPIWAWIPAPPDLTKPVEPTEPPPATPK